MLRTVERPFNMLNMSSTTARSTSTGPVGDDRTTRARIRDAAIETFAAEGISGTTARKVAVRAGVSPGLVIHHFGSMDGLRAACDAHIAAVIRDGKSRTMRNGAGLDPLAALRDPNLGPILGYLAKVLTDDAPAVADLVDTLVADAQITIDEGVSTGLLKPTADPRARAAVLTIWSLGALVLSAHLRRILGVDLTDPDLADDPAMPAYTSIATELLSRGVISDDFADRIQRTLDVPARAMNPDDEEDVR
jgi:AcrR family transcriptional regulator